MGCKIREGIFNYESVNVIFYINIKIDSLGKSNVFPISCLKATVSKFLQLVIFLLLLKKLQVFYELVSKNLFR